MKKTFKDSTLEKCIEHACIEFGLEEKDLGYKVIKEREGIFIKRITIEAWPLDNKKTEEDKNETVEEYSTEEKLLDEYIKINENDGTVKVEDGKLIVTNAKKDGKAACILIPKDITLLVNGEKALGKIKAYENLNLEVYFDETPACRSLDISISEDKMSAYISITYTPKNIYVLEDCKERNTIELKKRLKAQKLPPKYTIDEIKEELSNQGIVYGIIEENIVENVEKNCFNILIAKGDMPQDGTDDQIECMFPIDESMKKLKQDSNGNVDFKSIGSIKAVEKGEVIAVRHVGKPGKEGKDVTGKIKKCVKGKKIKLKIGEGCELKDKNTIVSSIEGKPCVKNNIFYVYKIHEVEGDVDVTTGNIKFVGDIIVHGRVKEGMEVLSGNSIIINKDVERAKIKGKGNILIKGNILASDIIGGGEDVGKLRFMENLETLKAMVLELASAVSEIKKFNLLGERKKDGEIIKILIETKFRLLPRTCLSIIRDMTILDNEEEERVITSLIKNKLIGLAPINIKNYNELNSAAEVLENRILEIKGELDLPVTVKIDYCQDSRINSSGDIIIAGKGEYVSSIVANGSVYFVEGRGLARGGTIRAKDEIKCKTVGSSSGVTTRLIVEDEGQIWADIAYQNTRFRIGQREFLLEIPSKNVHAYIDKQGEIMVDRLML